jgi:hypothetical protein
MASPGRLNALPVTPMLPEFTNCMDPRKAPAEVLDTLHGLSLRLRFGGGVSEDLGLEIHPLRFCIPLYRKAGGRSTAPSQGASTIPA